MQDFDKIIRRDGPTLVDFFATWCGPCRMQHPVVERFEKQMNGRADVYRIDIDDRNMNPIVRRYNIMSVPTMIFFRRGEILWRKSGVTGYDELVRVLNELEQHEEVPQR